MFPGPLYLLTTYTGLKINNLNLMATLPAFLTIYH